MDVCNRVVLIGMGRIRADGNPRELMSNDELMKVHGQKKTTFSCAAPGTALGAKWRAVCINMHLLRAHGLAPPADLIESHASEYM